METEGAEVCLGRIMDGSATQETGAIIQRYKHNKLHNDTNANMIGTRAKSEQRKRIERKKIGKSKKESALGDLKRFNIA